MRRERTALAREVGRAICRLHDAGVEHRDLQLRNVLLTGQGSKRRVVVVDKPDLGQARIILAHEGIARTEPERHDDVHFMTLDVVGQDHPGIIHHLAAVIAARGINIEELESGLESAPMAGGTMFHASARLRAPRSVRLEDLQRDLEGLADDLMVDIDLDEPA